WSFRNYEIMFDNTQPNITISATNGSSVETGSSLSYTINEPFSYVMFGWNNLGCSRSYEKLIPVPVENGYHNLSILICDLAGNMRIANYTYNVINFSGSTAIDFYLRDEYRGLLNQSFIDLQIHSEQSLFKIDYEIVGPSIVSFSRTNLEKERMYLHPGLYSLSVTYHINLFESRKRTFEFHICNGQEASELYGTALNETYSESILVTFPYFDVSFTINDISSIFVADGTHDIFYMLTTYPGVQYNIKYIIDTELPEITIISPNKGEEATDVFLEIDSNAVEVYFKLEHDSSLFLYNKTQVFLDYNQEGRQLITFYLVDSYYNTKTVFYVFYNSLSYVPVILEFQVFLFGNVFNISFLDVSISSEYNSTTWTEKTDVNGKLNMNIFPGKFDVNFVYSNITYNFLLDTDNGLYQTMYLGKSFVTLTILDNYVGSPIINQYCVIRDLDGNRIAFLQTNSLGEVSATIPVGDYIIHFTRSYELLSAQFQVYSQEQQIVFEIPSPRKLVQFIFEYDNGSKVYNLPVTFQTIIDGNITTNTKLYSSITLWLPYSFVNISYFQLDGKLITLTRSFEPGREVITIKIISESDSQYGKIPFKPISGFTFIVSVALEYMDYYLKGSLLFTYTLAYTEIILILLIVIVNMYSILQNVYKENKRETRILRMIGGTTTNALTTVFSRLGLVAVVTSFIGYALGLTIIKILANANQTVFFGHTFSPSGGWIMFLINGVLTIFIALITTLFINRNARKEKRIVYSKR
ncbi:MAG: ABC transporter permease, partial [Candidatus Heimdallarchaeaceae archaeon]